MFNFRLLKDNNDFIFTNLKRKCRVAMFLSIVFVFSVFTAYAAPQAKQVTIINNDKAVQFITSKSKVANILSDRGIKLTSHDEVIPAAESEVYDGMTIKIKYAKKINLVCDGYNVVYYTTADTFGDFLEKENISLSAEDISSMGLNDEISNNDLIKITRVSIDIYEEDHEIPYTTKRVDDDKLPMGQTKVITAGEKGIKKTCYEIKYVDGKEKSRLYAGEYVAKEPVEEVIAVGTAGNVATIGGQTINYSKVLTCQATAYDLSFQSTGKRPGHPAYGITASGTYAKMGTVAVDPRVIPLGTKMYIVSTDGSVVYGYCTAEDTGGAIKGNKVDLFYNTTSECMQFGRRSVYVYIL